MSPGAPIPQFEEVIRDLENHVRTTYIPKLESYFGVESEVPDELRKEGRDILFEAYREEVNFFSYVKIWMLVGIFDLLFVTPIQSYGILTSLYASMMLAADTWEGPASIAERVYLKDSPKEKMELRAKESAIGVEGTVFLAVGFVFQLLAVSSSRTELIHQSLLQGQFNAAFVAFIFVIGAPYLGHLREGIYRLFLRK